MNWLPKRSGNETRCILEILTSKRLLVDHLEVAEVCFRLAPNADRSTTTTTTIRVPFKAVCAGCIAAVAASTRYARSHVRPIVAASVVSGTVLLLGAVAYEKLHYYRDLGTITNLLRAIEQYDTAAKRMLIFINEVIYGNERINSVRRSTTENELLEACMESCTKAIYELYDSVKVLEERTELREEYGDAYDPLESFEDCEIFKQTATNHSNAKSHCLLRLSLAMASGTAVAEIRPECNRLTGCLTRRAEDLTRQLRLNSVSQADCFRQLGKAKEPTAKELAALKHQSLELTVKLAANVNHMLALDKAVQSVASTTSTSDRQQLEEAASQLATMQSYLLTRTDECERLLITAKKLLNNAPEEQATGALDEEELDAVPLPDTLGEPLALAPNSALDWQDEFFVNTGAEGDEELNEGAAGTTLDQLQAEDELVAKRLMRKQFQPILRQLRERLVPVEQSFRERERAAMKRKGIVLPEADEMGPPELEESMRKAFANGETDDESADSDGSADTFRLKRRTQTRYDEDRDFLASKPQFSLLAVTLPTGVQMEESILE
ncbi:AGAP000762-PA [Anopheles gambiae str. PEST]|uniref:AGAP000762-PA n=1 Tax=Anopheles gambiae TaxID=7165 RepID=Q5TUQ2_ANOGA|nr:AGAP000762-PA [Anopheles gambiae str. PEST]